MCVITRPTTEKKCFKKLKEKNLKENQATTFTSIIITATKPCQQVTTNMLPKIFFLFYFVIPSAMLIQKKKEKISFRFLYELSRDAWINGRLYLFHSIRCYDL